MAELPIMLLAAGGSRRMGQAKQLLPWGNSTLIEHQVQTLIKTGKPVVVVLGCQFDRILPILKTYPVVPLVHTKWQEGMGTSISYGILEVEKEFPEAGGVLICQLDQPMITASHYNQLLSAFQPGSPQIIVSRSASGWEGVPVLFEREYFKELKLLRGEEGARKIFRSHSSEVIIIQSRDVLEDLDHPEDYERLLAQYLEK